MKKTTIALMAVACLVVCSNGSKAEQQTAGTESTAVVAEEQIDSDVPEQIGVMEGNNFTFDLGTGVLTFKGVRYEFAHVEGGTFTMGATADDKEANDDEKPAHQVTLDSYYIGKTEVTWAFWKAVMGSYPPDAEGQGEPNNGQKHPDNWPVDNVSWQQCQEFILALQENFGELTNFSLPTEAEWEFAARGGNPSKNYKYSGSNTLGDVAWYDDNSENGPHEVATQKPNELGIYDMSGNVDEWCRDLWGKYSGKAETNPLGPDEGSESRVLRGGNCFMEDKDCRVTARSQEYPELDDNPFYGFRLVFKIYSEGEGEDE